jgi:alpha-tubulin suppressor-like RCC1 family protein
MGTSDELRRLKELYLPPADGFVLVNGGRASWALAAEGVIQISAGNDHTCVLSDGGAVTCWGFNEHEELGDGTTSDSAIPVPVVGLSSGVVAISAGAHDTCALLESGGVKCWGYNGNGELGDGTGETGLVPVDVVGLPDATGISTGPTHTCAVIEDGGAK